MNPVVFAKIHSKYPLIYMKDQTIAERIEMVHIEYNGEEIMWDIVAQKNLYQVGDEVLFIMPDYCLSDSVLFTEHTNPSDGKSKLGKNNRVKAIKFNSSKNYNDTNPVYSQGVLLPKKFVDNFLAKENIILTEDSNLMEVFGVTKYVESLQGSGAKVGYDKGDKPSFLYTTDEDRIEIHKSKFDGTEPIRGTIKYDGSSITLYVRKNMNGEYEKGVCSRSKEKQLNAVKYEYDGWRRHFDRDLFKKGYLHIETNRFVDEDSWEKVVEEENLPKIEIPVDDDWVTTSKEYLDKLFDYCVKNNISLAVRGELFGSNMKGSGNKLNPHAKLPKQIKFYSLDFFDNGIAKRQPCDVFDIYMEALDFPKVEVVFEQNFNNYQEAIDKCNEIFNRDENITYEGIVLRSVVTNKVSVKYINPKYDASF